MADPAQKKRHHYVPIAYLAQFGDPAGRIYTYRKDGPAPPLHVRPGEIAFERYYYSQPLPEGGQDKNRLEDLFSTVETHWPGLVEDLTNGRDVRNRMELLFQFMGLLRVRVPAARDPVELHLARMVRRTAARLVRDGEIPPPPPGHEDLLEEMVVAIDPHQSLRAMVDMLNGFGRLTQFIGFEVVHNTSSEDFITSDNPVIVFDPDVPEASLLPYTVRPPHRRVELLLPISPKVMIRGRSELPVITPGMQPTHTETARAADVRRVNRFVARFGYRFAFANHPGIEKLVTKYGALSPTVRLDDMPDGDGGEYHFTQMVFGPRPRKPKWSAKE
jgi:hypothetical protein